MSRKKSTWIMALLVWGSALVIAAAVSYLFKLNFFLCFGLVAIAWVLNGVIAEVEDRLPGGFLNPRRKDGGNGPDDRS